MRILYIVHSTKMEGSTISFINMVIGIHKKGVDIGIIAPQNEIDEKFKEICNKNNFSLFSSILVASILPKPHLGLRMYHYFKLPIILLNKYKSKKNIISIAKIFKADIIHTNTGVIHEGYKASLELNIPHVWHLREYQDKDFNWLILPSKNYYMKMLHKSNVISISSGIQEHFRLTDSKNASIIYNGIYSINKQWVLVDKEPYFLVASRLNQEKGITEVIQSFADFRTSNHNYRLKLAGYGNEYYVDSLKVLSVKLGINDYVDFLGFVEDVSPLMRKAKALIVASYNEGFGRMTAEAAFNGCVVIGRNTGGTKEIIDYTGGLLFDGTNKTLLDCMLEISNMPAKQYNNMALVAQNRAIAKYSIESNVDGVYNYYNQILNQGV